MSNPPDPTAYPGRILSGEREVSQLELLGRVARAASGFASLGLGNGDAVALMLRNDFPFFEASMAANLVGAYAVPINWHYRADEAGYILRDCQAKVLVAHADLLPQIARGVPPEIELFVVPTPPEVRDAYRVDPEACSLENGQRAWAEWLEAQAPRPLEAPSAPSSMIYTSGTTGNPKGVRRDPPTPETAARFAQMVFKIFGFGEDGDFRTAITGPMYHSAPNAYGLYAARNGGFCVLQPRFDPLELLQLIEQHRLTHLHMVPTMFVRLLQLGEEERSRFDLSSLQFVVHAAAPCPADVKRAMIEWWGPVIYEYYGATETGGVVFHGSEEALRKPGTVGKAIEGGIVKILDEQGGELGPGEVGEVYLRIEGMADFTYHGNDEKRRAIERQGLVTVGDIGYLDDDGYLFLCDRKNDMVISGGVNIYPAEIEAALIGMEGVKDCAVFGIPDEEFGEALAAYVEPLPGARLDAGKVRAFLADKLARYKVPRLIEFSDDLPREDSGKIFKRKLRAPYWEKAGRQI
ncbi:MAG: long-chain fatty acid--CoA ligase [Acidobacteria bacterium]|nr:MAG: long-chain fatty acid--CoA ligase [Acidobacteriota bacterium]REK03214.1 MAG: long-chain fatty acid--CoA ligase [Acidobacteriota bacterium]